MLGRIYREIVARTETMFPDGRTSSIALNHLMRHEEQGFREDNGVVRQAILAYDCANLKIRLDQFKKITGFPSEW
jgi:hypothetical protein